MSTLDEVYEWYETVRTHLPVTVFQAGETASEAIRRRALEHGLACSRCGRPATSSTVGRQDGDVDRWVDLCADCFVWVGNAK